MAGKSLKSYDMTHKRRGQMIIISNQRFPHGWGDRNGTEDDAIRLKTTFKKLGFEPTIQTNLTKDEMLQSIIKVAQSDHSECDCLAIAILSHGSQENGKDILIGSDGGSIPLEDLMKPLKKTEFKAGDKMIKSTLAGKPKLIFIQACRGEQLDAGVGVLEPDSSSDDLFESDGLTQITIPVEADFLYFYSTASGYYAWRPTKGAVFIQTLCDVLEENLDGKTDLVSLLTDVNCHVAQEYQSNCSRRPQMHCKKQMPVIQSQLLKRIFLTPNK